MLSILRGETSAQEAARKHGLTVAEIEGWQERYLLAAENALRSRQRQMRSVMRHWDVTLPVRIRSISESVTKKVKHHYGDNHKDARHEHPRLL